MNFRHTIAEGAMREFELGGEGRKGEKKLVSGTSYTSGFDGKDFTQVGWFGFMEETE